MTLTLAEAVLPVAVDTAVTVAYTAPETGPLQDSDNAKLPVTGFGGTKTVTNDTPADNTAPTFVSAVANAKTVIITYSEALDESVNPFLPDYQARFGSGGFANARSVSISGRTVTATYAVAASHGQAVTVKYAATGDAARRLKDLSGNQVAFFSLKPATNNTPPAFSSATVDGAALTVTFNGALDTGSVPAADAFTVTVAGDEVRPGGYQPGLHRRLGGDADARRGGGRQPAGGDGGLHRARHRPAPGFRQREAPGDGLRQHEDGDQQYLRLDGTDALLGSDKRNGR